MTGSEAGARNVRIYGTEFCSYCMAARMLLTKKGVPFDDILVSRDHAALEEMRKLSGRDTVPQIFIASQHIGGYDELAKLDAAGELDGILAGDN